MSKPKHSPLPWKIEDGGGPDWLDGIRCQYAIRTDDGKTIAYVFDKPDAEAIINNQQAIAELVEVLAHLLRDYDEYCDVNNLHPNSGCKECWASAGDARALIAKHKAKP